MHPTPHLQNSQKSYQTNIADITCLLS